jgi:hypothetical protein
MLRNFAVALALALAGCASGTAGRRAADVSAGDELPSRGSGAATLPPVPLVEGELAIKVQYPPPDHLIEARDSTFLFGSVGNGKAT